MILRKQLDLEFGSFGEKLVDDGRREEEFVFVPLSHDLSDYEFIPGTGELITKIAIAQRIDPISAVVRGKRWESP